MTDTARYEVEGMQLIPNGGRPWAEVLTETPSPAVARVVGALVDIVGSRRHALQIAHRLAEVGLLAEWTPLEECSCKGRRWSEDENWSPDYPELWRGERSEGNGLIPCGACNHGGWDVDQWSPEVPGGAA